MRQGDRRRARPGSLGELRNAWAITGLCTGILALLVCLVTSAWLLVELS